ncbi:MAG: hypothetical protein II008_17885 [Oscillospiraceae bacterium]|nr:hypothetical protein [Oscillospiraceae bacterium]
MKNALSLIENPSKYLPTAQEMQAVMTELGDILNRNIFGVITIAGGGAGVFKVLEPGAEETTNGVQEITGVIVASHLVNVRWGHDYGTRQQGERPICRSMDGLSGVDQETGETHSCAACPYNQFGENGERKACGNKRQLYIMREGDLLPVLFALPPSALKAFDNYRVQASLTLRTPMSALVTRITLKNKVSNGGSEYSTPVFTALGKLPVEEGRRMEAFARQIMDAAQRAGISADEVGEDAQAAPAGNGGFVQVDEDELPFT